MESENLATKANVIEMMDKLSECVPRFEYTDLCDRISNLVSNEQLIDEC